MVWRSQWKKHTQSKNMYGALKKMQFRAHLPLWFVWYAFDMHHAYINGVWTHLRHTHTHTKHTFRWVLFLCIFGVCTKCTICSVTFLLQTAFGWRPRRIAFNKLVFRIMHMHNNFPTERCCSFRCFEWSRTINEHTPTEKQKQNVCEKKASCSRIICIWIGLFVSISRQIICLIFLMGNEIVQKKTTHRLRRR